ncbi:hypothetical protein J6590_060998 [Homalodisca vitripennis]|nr:hypothetical protein J6590_060998 [Homalodisca vitripennis]
MVPDSQTRSTHDPVLSDCVRTSIKKQTVMSSEYEYEDGCCPPPGIPEVERSVIKNLVLV